MRIALHCDKLTTWQGGRDLLHTLYHSLLLSRSDEDQVFLTAAKKDKFLKKLKRIGKHLLSTHQPDWGGITQEIARRPKRDILRGVFGSDAAFTSVNLKRGRLGGRARPPIFDVIGPIDNPPPVNLSRAWIGYIPDCQHRHLPHLFSEQERALRDNVFSKTLKIAPVVFVNSEHAKSDLEKFYGAQNAVIVPMPFSASPDPAWFDVNRAKIVQEYRLPERFFICSNQFWIHKNHRVVFQAMALARSQCNPVNIVFTGQMDEYRDPHHVPDLIKQIEEMGIKQDCRFLGLIPKVEQIAIMRSAVALIQPTLFEGAPGGGAVYDAVSVGQRVIVSDIEVNREISNCVDAYFPPHDAAKLLEAMRVAENWPKPQISESQLIAQGTERLRAFGVALHSAYALALERTTANKN